MATKTINQLPTASTIDGSADILPIYTASSQATQGISRNTYLGITGSPVGTSDSQSLTNKTIGNTNSITVKDGSLTLQNTSDTTKQAVFSLSGITTGTTRTYTLPNATDTLVGLAASQTLTNKTLTSPTINTPTISNATITADTVAGFSTSNNGTIYGMSVTGGILASAAIAGQVVTASLATGIQVVQASKNPYKFRAYRQAAANSGNGAFAAIVFDNKTYDTGTNFSTGTGLFTAPVAGFYQFNAQAEGASSSVEWAISLYKNGSEVSRGSRTKSSTSLPASTVSDCIQLSANDTVGVYCFATSTTALDVSGSPDVNNYFSGFLVSAT